MSTKSQKILWHYTSIETLTKILTNQNMRATHHSFMNDAKEIKTGVDKFLEVINLSQKDRLKIETRYFKDLTANLEELSSGTSMALFYLISLSKKKDSLSQWRGYTPPAGGCAIGFNTDLLIRAFTQYGLIYNKSQTCDMSTNEPDLLECSYTNRKSLSNSKINKAIAEYVNARKKIQAEFIKGNCNIDPKYALSAWKSILKLVACIKHKGFENEAEVRLVFRHKPTCTEIKFENGKAFLEIKFDLSVFPRQISEVMISPHGDRERNKHYVQFLSRMMFEKHYQNPSWTDAAKQRRTLFKVTESKLSYRG